MPFGIDDDVWKKTIGNLGNFDTDAYAKRLRAIRRDVLEIAKEMVKSDEEIVVSSANGIELSPMMRPTKHEYYLDIALSVSRRSTCLRSAYGAVIVLDDRIVSTGYNGSRSGAKNCCDDGKRFREGEPSRMGYRPCVAVHSKPNSII